MPDDAHRLARDLDVDARSHRRHELAVRAQRFAREELEDVAGARGFADAFGLGLAFLAREQGAQLFLAREDLVADLVEDVGALLDAAERPLGERAARRRDGGFRLCASACAYSPTRRPYSTD